MKWAVFISGRGTNLKALLEHKPEFNIGLVVSSRASAPGIEYAKKHGKDIYVLKKEPSWMALCEALAQSEITHIFLAGFLKVLPPEFLSLWTAPVYNLHPSLLPEYPGLKSIERAYKDKSDVGVSIHKVIAEVDSGEVCLQKWVYKSDELEGLSLEQVTKQVHAVEHQMVCEFMSGMSKNDQSFDSKKESALW